VFLIFIFHFSQVSKSAICMGKENDASSACGTPKIKVEPGTGIKGMQI